MANPIQLQIQAKIESFTRELEALVRQAAVTVVGDALGNPRAAAKMSGPRAAAPRKAAKGRRGSKKTAPKAAAVLKTARKGAKRAGKRTSVSLKSGAAAEQILAAIKAHPGQRSEVTRASVGVARNVWMPAIAKLIAEKKIVRSGEKRGTTFAAK